MLNSTTFSTPGTVRIGTSSIARSRAVDLQFISRIAPCKILCGSRKALSPPSALQKFAVTSGLFCSHPVLAPSSCPFPTVLFFEATIWGANGTFRRRGSLGLIAHHKAAPTSAHLVCLPLMTAEGSILLPCAWSTFGQDRTPLLSAAQPVPSQNRSALPSRSQLHP